MAYIAVEDLKKTRYFREKLEKEKELIPTKDGQPFALVIGISPENLEDSLAEVRRALFSAAVKKAKEKALGSTTPFVEIENEIRESRKKRGLA